AIKLIRAFQQLLSVIILRKHVENENILKPIVIHVCDIRPHTKLGQVGEDLVRYFRKGTIAVVDVAKVLLFIIVGHIDIRVVIKIKITDSCTESKVETASMKAALVAHVMEFYHVPPIHLMCIVSVK